MLACLWPVSNAHYLACFPCFWIWVLSRSIWRGIIPAERRGSLAYNHGKWAMDRDPRGQHFSWPLACGRQTSGEERLLLARMVGMDIIRTHYTRRWKKDQERKSNKQFQPPEIFLKYCNLMDKIKGGSPYWHTENILIKKKKTTLVCVYAHADVLCVMCVLWLCMHMCVSTVECRGQYWMSSSSYFFFFWDGHCLNHLPALPPYYWVAVISYTSWVQV